MIRLCSDSEALEILNEPQNVKRIGIVSERMKYQPWICEDGEYKIMFVFWSAGDDTFEIHIASKRNSILKSRSLAKEVISFMFEHGAKRLITTCPKGKISNFAIKIGMSAYKTDGETIYFEVMTWL